MSAFASEKVLAELVASAALLGATWLKKLPRFHLDDTWADDKAILWKIKRSALYRVAAAITLVVFQCLLAASGDGSRFAVPLITFGVFLYVRFTRQPDIENAQASALLAPVSWTSARLDAKDPTLIPVISVIATVLLGWTDFYSIQDWNLAAFLLLNGITFFVCLSSAARNAEGPPEKTGGSSEESAKFVRYIAACAIVASILLLVISPGMAGTANLVIVVQVVLRTIQAFGLIYFASENAMAASSTATVATIASAIVEDPSTLPGLRYLLAFAGTSIQVLITLPKATDKRFLLFATLFLPGLILPTISNVSLAPSAVKQAIIDPLTTLPSSFAEDHPVVKLHKKWTKRQNDKLARQSKTLSEAALEYTRRYRKAPPPGFDKWFQFAQEKEYLMIDEFDTLMNSMEPFWHVSPQNLHKRLRSAIDEGENFAELEVKGGKITRWSMDHWYTNAIKTWFTKWDHISPLPDFNFTLNAFDEPRTAFYPEYMGLGDITGSIDKNNVTFSHLRGSPLWPYMKPTCPNQGQPEIDDESHYTMSSHGLHFMDSGTSSQDVCFSRSLRIDHGFFRAPATMIVTHNVLPIFSQAVPQRYNDIMIPTPYYYSAVDGDLNFNENDTPWESKIAQTYWAGGSTGGAITVDNWKHIHRNRVSLMTSNSSMEPVTLLKQNTLGQWKPEQSWWGSIAKYFHVKVTRLVQCTEKACELMRHQFDLKEEQSSNTLKYKYLLDIDGNSYTGRFYRLLRGNSCVVKSTIFREWHDDLLMPWVHYIPLSNGAHEFGEMMRFLIEEPEGDKIGRAIGAEGREWANRSLRKEDMEVYALRVFMEYARLFDERRDFNGYYHDPSQPNKDRFPPNAAADEIDGADEADD